MTPGQRKMFDEMSKGNSFFKRRKRRMRRGAVEEEKKRPVDPNGMRSAWISRLLVLKLLPPEPILGAQPGL